MGRSVPGGQNSTTWTPGSKKLSRVPSITLTGRTKSHCSTISSLYFSDGISPYRILESVLDGLRGRDRDGRIFFKEKKALNMHIELQKNVEIHKHSFVQCYISTANKFPAESQAP